MNRSKFARRICALRITALLLAVILFAASGACLPAGAAGSDATWGSSLGAYDVLIQRSYNEYGLLVCQLNSRSRDTTTYEYDENGVLRIQVIYEFESDGASIYSTQTIFYDEYGYPISDTQVWEDDGTTVSVTYDNRYDRRGRLVSSKKYDSDGVLLEQSKYTYKNNGSYVLVINDYSKKNDAPSTLNTYTYTYDSHGNLERYVEETIMSSRREFYSKTTLEYENTYFGDRCVLSAEYATYYYSSMGDTTKSPRELACFYVYEYNGQGQNIAARRFDIDGSETFTETWEYDEYGNPLRYTDGSQVIAYDNLYY